MSKSFMAFRDLIVTRTPWRGILIGSVLMLVMIWMLFSPEGVLGKADAVGYAVCHRIAHRSFHIGDYQFAVCARCAGQYLGAVLGIVFLSLLRPRRAGRPPWSVILILLIGLFGYAVDGLNSFLHLIPWTEHLWIYEPNNTLRLITGTLVGLGISIMLFPAFNQTIWQQYDPRPAINLRYFFVLLGLAIVLVGLVLTENPIFLYPLSLLSAAGVLMLLTMVYTMVWVMIFRFENHFDVPHRLRFPLLAGFAVALLQILALDGIRYWLTGTWGGFPLG